MRIGSSESKPVEISSGESGKDDSTKLIIASSHGSSLPTQSSGRSVNPKSEETLSISDFVRFHTLKEINEEHNIRRSIFLGDSLSHECHSKGFPLFDDEADVSVLDNDPEIDLADLRKRDECELAEFARQIAIVASAEDDDQSSQPVNAGSNGSNNDRNLLGNGPDSSSPSMNSDESSNTANLEQDPASPLASVTSFTKAAAGIHGSLTPKSLLRNIDKDEIVTPKEQKTKITPPTSGKLVESEHPARFVSKQDEPPRMEKIKIDASSSTIATTSALSRSNVDDSKTHQPIPSEVSSSPSSSALSPSDPKASVPPATSTSTSKRTSSPGANNSSLKLKRDWYSTSATFIAGGVAGAASRTLTAPLDRVKIIVQEGHLVAPKSTTSTARLNKSQSLMDVVRMIYQDGGIRSFWRGNVLNCFKAGPEFAIVFSLRRYFYSLYEELLEKEKRRQKRVREYIKKKKKEIEDLERLESTEREAITGVHESECTFATSKSVQYEELEQKQRIMERECSIFPQPFNRFGSLTNMPRLFINFSIGAAAGFGAQIILYPLEVVKTRLVVSTSSEFKGGVREVFLEAYRRGGIGEFYKGLTPNMAGILLYRGFEMGIYSNVQQSLMMYRMQWQGMSRHDAALNSIETGAVGMFASTIAQTISYPFNVVRTRLQTQGTNGRQKKYNGMVDCFVKMVRTKGVASLFSGITANYLKAIPASACTFVVFEKVQSALLGDD